MQVRAFEKYIPLNSLWELQTITFCCDPDIMTFADISIASVWFLCQLVFFRQTLSLLHTQL